jgi:hypothetical protein
VLSCRKKFLHNVWVGQDIVMKRGGLCGAGRMEHITHLSYQLLLQHPGHYRHKFLENTITMYNIRMV